MNEDKSFYQSKTIQFNTIHGLLIPAIWPFLPEHFRQNDYAVPALTAWISICNIILRFVTHESISFWGKNEKKS